MHNLLWKNDQQRSNQKTGADFGASELGILKNIINGFDFPYPLIGTKQRSTKSGGFDDNAVI